ncbi:MAG: hypothetical protein IJW67_06220 [Blautia sp.]|nr:hypothetical protein [Blautia sp.]
MKTELKHPYVSVISGETVTCGGNQKLHPDPAFQKDGCGVVAGTDWILYKQGRKRISQEAYQALLDDMNRIYLPYQPNHGMSGFVFAKGMNRYCRSRKLPWRFIWGVPRKRLFSSIEEMLKADLTVVLTVGPSAPWKKKTGRQLGLYQKNGQGIYAKVRSTGGHYMTVTGMDENWLQVSSWGEAFFINRREYLEYASEYSFYFYTNIFRVKVL